MARHQAICEPVKQRWTWLEARNYVLGKAVFRNTNKLSCVVFSLIGQCCRNFVLLLCIGRNSAAHYGHYCTPSDKGRNKCLMWICPTFCLSESLARSSGESDVLIRIVQIRSKILARVRLCMSGFTHPTPLFIVILRRLRPFWFAYVHFSIRATGEWRVVPELVPVCWGGGDGKQEAVE